ncbi:hypothetical protein Q8F57_000635 [Paraburkholderia terrae]|uniref:hypothetical protein n=1 Tax=Paraburkholderia terrae TaxID=311230 RepID=UPI00296B1F20|nr:hypothetical protein [Paraburkholderia terrae]MDW3663783.1 hypothetical protein [Paraburkholderia terrae]
METWVSQLGAAQGRTLLVRCKQGERDNQLGCARAWAAKLCARCPVRRVVVGIDGIDLWLTSPSVAACQLHAILNVGAAVVCAVDSRYGDSRLLAFHLRILGIVVIRELHLPKRLTCVSAGLGMPRFSPDSKSGALVRSFPYVHTPTLAAYMAERKNPGAQTTPDHPLNQRELKGRRTSGGAALSALSQYERVEYARAYRNGFSVNRLLRERFGL